MEKECVLYDRKCISCGECDICDLDSKKLCDNCGKCIESGNDYNIMDVDLTAENGDEPLNYHCEEDTEEELLDESFENDELDEDFFEDDFDEDLDGDDDLEFDFGEFFGQR